MDRSCRGERICAECRSCRSTRPAAPTSTTRCTVAPDQTASSRFSSLPLVTILLFLHSFICLPPFRLSRISPSQWATISITLHRTLSCIAAGWSAHRRCESLRQTGDRHRQGGCKQGHHRLPLRSGSYC